MLSAQSSIRYRSLMSTHGARWVFLAVLAHGAVVRGADVPFRHVVIDLRGVNRPHCKAAGDINDDGFADVVIGGRHFGEREGGLV